MNIEPYLETYLALTPEGLADPAEELSGIGIVMGYPFHTVCALSDDRSLRDNMIEELERVSPPPPGAMEARFRVTQLTYIEAQRDEYGRVELPAFWDYAMVHIGYEMAPVNPPDCPF